MTESDNAILNMLIDREEQVIAALENHCGKTDEEADAMTSAKCMACVGYRPNEVCPRRMHRNRLARLKNRGIYAQACVNAYNLLVASTAQTEEAEE